MLTKLKNWIKIRKSNLDLNIQKYINKFLQSKYYSFGKKIKDYLKTKHEQIKSVNMDVVDDLKGRNPYQAFLDWLLDVCASGVQITLVTILVFGQRYSFFGFIAKTFGFGLIVEIIKMARKAIKGEE